MTKEELRIAHRSLSRVVDNVISKHNKTAHFRKLRRWAVVDKLIDDDASWNYDDERDQQIYESLLENNVEVI